MGVVLQIQGPAGLRIPSSTTIRWNRIPPLSPRQACDKPFCQKHASFLGYRQCENTPVFWLDDNPTTRGVRSQPWLPSRQLWIRNSIFLVGCPFGSVFLNQLPNCNMASLDNMQKDNALVTLLVEKP
jgi:hypothetical protein